MNRQRKGLELFRIAFYLAVPVACVWIYNKPDINKSIANKYRPNIHEYSDDPKLARDGPDTSPEGLRESRKRDEEFRENVLLERRLRREMKTAAAAAAHAKAARESLAAADQQNTSG